MSDSLKDTVQELTKAKAENVTLTGRLEGVQREYEKLDQLFEQAKLENDTLRRRLNGQINELRSMHHQGSKGQDEVADDVTPTRRSGSVRGRGRDSGIDLSRDVGNDLSRDVVKKPSRDRGPKSLGDDYVKLPKNVNCNEEVDSVPIAPGKDEDKDGEDEEEWEPLFLENSDGVGARRLSASPPREAARPADLQRQISDITTSVEEVTDGQKMESVINKLTKLADDVCEMEDTRADDKRKVVDLEKLCQDRKVRIQELELELMNLRYENRMLNLRVTGEKQKSDDAVEPSNVDVDKIRSEHDSKFEKMRVERENLFAKMNHFLLDSKKEQQESQAKLNAAQQELNIQVRTNQELQKRVSELEDERWQWQHDLNALRDENERVRNDRRMALPSMSTSRRETYEQELEAMRCQAQTYKEDFENERKDREKLANEKDDVSEHLRNTVKEFEKLKYSSEKKERIFKRRLDALEKENRDYLRVLDEYERLSATTVRGNVGNGGQDTTGRHGSQQPAAVAAAATAGQTATSGTIMFTSNALATTAVSGLGGGAGGTSRGTELRARGTTAPSASSVYARQAITPGTRNRLVEMGIGEHPSAPVHQPIVNTERPAPERQPILGTERRTYDHQPVLGTERRTYDHQPVLGTEGRTAAVRFNESDLDRNRSARVMLPATTTNQENALQSLMAPNWQCQHCTFSNSPYLKTCEICYNPRFTCYSDFRHTPYTGQLGHDLECDKKGGQ